MANVGVTRISEEYYFETGMRSFSVRIKEGTAYKSLAGYKVELIIFDSQSRQTYNWSTQETDPEKLLVLEPENLTGKIVFPKIKLFPAKIGLHVGDLKLTDPTGFVDKYRTFEFPVERNF